MKKGTNLTLIILSISFLNFNSNPQNNQKIINEIRLKSSINDSFKFYIENKTYDLNINTFNYYFDNDNNIIIDPFEYNNELELPFNLYNLRIDKNFDIDVLISYKNYSYHLKNKIDEETYELILNKTNKLDANVLKKNRISYRSVPNNFNGTSKKFRKLLSKVDTTYLENLTSTDFYVDSYVALKKPAYDSYGRYLVDDIVNIVPQDYFINDGSRFYIGDEYGFYINTKNNPVYKYRKSSDVIVFDIEKELLNPQHNIFNYSINFKTNITYSTMIRSLATEMEWLNNHGHPDLNYAIYPIADTTDVYLKDIAFLFNLTNLNTLNVDQSGYNSYNDNGDYFVGYNLFYQANEINFNNDSTYKNNLELIFSTFKLFSSAFEEIIPQYGKVNFIFDIVDIINSMADVYGPTKYQVSVNEDKFYDANQYFRFENTAQIAQYGYLVKNMIVRPLASDGISTLYGQFEKNDYIKANILLNRSTKISTYEKMRLDGIINFEAVVDNTYKNIFGNIKGSIDLLNKCSTKRIISTYQRSD